MSYVTCFERLSCQEGLQQGIEKGKHIEASIIAKNMLNIGADRNFIKKATGLSDQDLLNLED